MGAAYRFPGTSSARPGSKKASADHALSYGPEAGAAYRQVRQRFFPEEIDEVDLLSGAFQLLAQGDTEAAAEWMEDLAAYVDRVVMALDAAGFGPEQNWRCQLVGVAQKYGEAADLVRSLIPDGAEEWLVDDPDRGITPRTRRDLLRLVRLVDATYVDAQVLGYYPNLDVAVEVPGPTLRGTFHLPTRRAHAVARMLQDRPDLLVDPPAAPEKPKAARRAPRASGKVLLPRFTTPIWIRNALGKIVAGGVPLFPDFLEAK